MATTAKKHAGPADKGLEVISKKDGFRRAGREWSGSTTVSLAELTEAEVQALKSEPMLVVREVDIEPAK